MAKPHIHFTVPYSFEKKIFEAYDAEFQKVDNPEDWVCIMDGDIFFFQANFGHIIQEHIQKYPDTGLLTCYTNRIGNPVQLYSDKAKRIDSIKYHFKLAKQLESENKGISSKHKSRVAGLLFVIKKETWNAIRDKIAYKCRGQKILGVDYLIADTMLENDYSIRRMEDLYVFHYRRMSDSSAERGLE